MNLAEEDMTPFQKKVSDIIDTAIEEEQGLKQVRDELLRLAHNEIEQKPAWSEEDASLCAKIQGILSVCKSHSLLSSDLCKEMCDWLKFLKDRVQPQPKQEWSEEEEKNFNHAIKVLKVTNFHNVADMLQEMKYKLIPRGKPIIGSQLKSS